MISKRDLLLSICDNREDINFIIGELKDLEKRVAALEPKKVKVTVKPTKKTRGRPVGSKDKKPRAKKTAAPQPRDNSGKFVKKK